MSFARGDGDGAHSGVREERDLPREHLVEGFRLEALGGECEVEGDTMRESESPIMSEDSRWTYMAAEKSVVCRGSTCPGGSARYRGTSLIRNSAPLVFYSSPMLREV